MEIKRPAGRNRPYSTISLSQSESVGRWRDVREGFDLGEASACVGNLESDPRDSLCVEHDRLHAAVIGNVSDVDAFRSAMDGLAIWQSVLLWDRVCQALVVFSGLCRRYRALSAPRICGFHLARYSCSAW